MYKVSDKYKQSIKASLRERAYILISFGLINQEAQSKAKFTNTTFNYFSNPKNIFRNSNDNTVYASLEENFMKVDGSMLFPPVQGENQTYYHNGVVSDSLVSDNTVTVTVRFDTLPLDFKGVTVDFGENYPVDFDITASDNQIVRVRGNSKSVFVTEEAIRHTSFISLRVYRMKNPQSRLRIFSMKFGYGIVYGNEKVVSSKLDSSVSPIGASVPQVDFSVTFKNDDLYYNVDNPDSAINFLETGQKVEVHYGYDCLGDGNVEWLKGNTLVCSDWEADNKTATIRCHDVLRTLNDEYYKGFMLPQGVSYYDLAVHVLEDAKITNYKIDSYLRTISTHNPMPRVKHREALQIIANACRCVLLISRDGGVEIKSNFTPNVTSSVARQEPHSNISNVLVDNTKVEYASFCTNNIRVDGSTVFMPTTEPLVYLNTGYVSEEISDSQGRFTSSPEIVLDMEASYFCYGLDLDFGEGVPSNIRVVTYNDNEQVETYSHTNTRGDRRIRVSHVFDEFTRMKIVFEGTVKPINRVIVNNLKLNYEPDFVMSRNDMKSSPKLVKQEIVKDITVPYCWYTKTQEEDTIFDGDILAVAGETKTFYSSFPVHNISVVSQNNTNVSVVESNCFYVTVRFATTGTHKLKITGGKYYKNEHLVTVSLNERGKNIRWDNPLVSDSKTATDLALWLKQYYSSNVEYEYSTRGFPELDVNDIISQENDFGNLIRVNLFEQSLEFSQAFSGTAITRRQVK